MKYDENAGTTTIQLQLRNVSKDPVYGPIVVRTTRIGETALGPAAEIANADRRDKTGFVWDFTRTLGGRPMLGPGGVTEVRTIVVRTRRETGLDATLELEVMGRRAVK